MQTMWRRELVALPASVVAIAGITAVLQELAGISSTTVALAYLLVVLAAATVASLRVAIVLSMIAMLALNFFFLPPVGGLTVADPQNWIALVAFLIVAVIASNLSTAAQDRAREAVERRKEVTRLFDLTRDVLLTTQTTGAIELLARQVASRFELAKVAICLPTERRWRIYQGADDVSVDTDDLDAALAKARGALESEARRRTSDGSVRAGERGEVALVPLQHGTKAVGLLAAVAPRLEIGTLDAIAGVVAIAIERAQFLVDRDAAVLMRQKADLAATLLASLSHDLRTPLTAIRVAVENLASPLPPDQRRAQTDAAIAELDRLTRLFQDILDMARIDAAAIPIERQWVTAADVVDAAAAQIRHALAGHALRVDADTNHEVQIDPRLTSMALSHVLENAAHYAPADKEIVVRAGVETDGLHVTVTDEGPGLDPGELEHLFERFYRGRTARLKTFGTGMGLSITRGLLTAAGGRIRAENVPGAGACFSITVPGPVRTATIPS